MSASLCSMNNAACFVPGGTMNYRYKILWWDGITCRWEGLSSHRDFDAAIVEANNFTATHHAITTIVSCAITFFPPPKSEVKQVKWKDA